jgi:hypothetical protein
MVHGLLQTARYAEALIRNVEGPSASDEQIGRWVQLRIKRQRVLDGEQPTKMAAVLDESVLHRPVGGGEVMREQLRHLLALGRRANIDIRVLPFRVGAHAGFDGAFMLFEMPDPYPEVAYVETLAGRLYLESPKTDRFVRAYDRLRAAALTAKESADLIEEAAKELS